MARWVLTLDVTDLLTKEDVDDEKAMALGKAIAPRIRKLTHSTFDERDEEERDRVADAFEEETFDQDDFNGWLSDLYDWADNVRVWVKSL
jgi:hypothetical protein